MKLLKKYTHIHGFEDYNIVSLSDGCLCSLFEYYLPYTWDNVIGEYIINKDLPVRISEVSHPQYYWIKYVEFTPELVQNNKELLNTATKIFVHPSCTLSRNLLAEKYKKILNPYLSDAVVIPNPTYTEFYLDKVALFINEKAKMIVKILITSDEAIAKIQNANMGETLSALSNATPDASSAIRRPYNVFDVMDSELFYYGEILCVPNSQSWAMDVLTHSIPVDKIVFESSIQNSLSSENNKLDFDSLCSIKDMLESSDEDTVSAGLKSLSMMDWMHYPQSIKFILNNVSSKFNWIYNKACNSTSVKYMIKTIAGDKVKRRTWWPGDYDEEIYEEDYELFKKLKCHYHHIQSDQIISSIRSFEFMTVNTEGFIAPRIKQQN